MNWNYRVVRNETGLRVFDVYYSEAGTPIATHESPTYVYGETIDDLRSQLERMLKALDMPVLEEGDIGGQK